MPDQPHHDTVAMHNESHSPQAVKPEPEPCICHFRALQPSSAQPPAYKKRAVR
ncbi:hypothetical protein K432DRAFT_386962 [Lepidopterella palustris CBS 459.81]|uniref:Uncharacterized protein n=1 Tax=Lepidopterella palustris CBS 459.81 TaxID=1314670 RepID=A0A8E2DYS9_9PEZI|nr:hypothetical protein K432DRAFT_386962 [Lepidopterella palustris CBS 459.81]